MTELPLGWQESALDDVCQVVRGITFPTNEKRFESAEGLIACLRTANVQAIVDWDDLWFVPRRYVKNDDQLVAVDDILISTANSYELVGKVSLVTHTKFASTLGAFISLLRAFKGVDPKFLYYQLSSDSIQRSIREMSSTTTNISNVSGAKLKTLVLRMAPTTEQVRIVAKLEELLSDLDAGVAELKAAQKKLQQYRQSLLKAAVEGALTANWREAQRQQGAPTATGAQLLARILTERRARWEAKQLAKFKEQGKAPPKNWREKYPEPVSADASDLPMLPEGWVWASVDQLGEIQGGIQKQPSRTPRENRFPFLRVANVARGELRLQEVHEVELFKGEFDRLVLKTGDVLIVEGNGSLTEIGRCAIWDGSIPNAVHQNHLIRVRPILLAGQWIEAWLNSPRGISKLTDLAATTSGLYTLSVSKIAKIPVPVPSQLEQDMAILRLEDAEAGRVEQLKAIEIGIGQSNAQRQNILRGAFAGKLVPQDANDEPASVLLERIRADQAERSGQPRTRKTKKYAEA